MGTVYGSIDDVYYQHYPFRFKTNSETNMTLETLDEDLQVVCREEYIYPPLDRPMGIGELYERPLYRSSGPSGHCSTPAGEIIEHEPPLRTVLDAHYYQPFCPCTGSVCDCETSSLECEKGYTLNADEAECLPICEHPQCNSSEKKYCILPDECSCFDNHTILDSLKDGQCHLFSFDVDVSYFGRNGEMNLMDYGTIKLRNVYANELRSIGNPSGCPQQRNFLHIYYDSFEIDIHHDGSINIRLNSNVSPNGLSFYYPLYLILSPGEYSITQRYGLCTPTNCMEEEMDSVQVEIQEIYYDGHPLLHPPKHWTLLHWNTVIFCIISFVFLLWILFALAFMTFFLFLMSLQSLLSSFISSSSSSSSYEELLEEVERKEELLDGDTQIWKELKKKTTKRSVYLFLFLSILFVPLFLIPSSFQTFLYFSLMKDRNRFSLIFAQDLFYLFFSLFCLFFSLFHLTLMCVSVRLFSFRKWFPCFRFGRRMNLVVVVGLLLFLLVVSLMFDVFIFLFESSARNEGTEHVYPKSFLSFLTVLFSVINEETGNEAENSPSSMWFLMILKVMEKVALYGIIAPLMVFLYWLEFFKSSTFWFFVNKRKSIHDFEMMLADQKEKHFQLLFRVECWHKEIDKNNRKSPSKRNEQKKKKKKRRNKGDEGRGGGYQRINDDSLLGGGGGNWLEGEGYNGSIEIENSEEEESEEEEGEEEGGGEKKKKRRKMKKVVRLKDKEEFDFLDQFYSQKEEENPLRLSNFERVNSSSKPFVKVYFLRVDANENKLTKVALESFSKEYMGKDDFVDVWIEKKERKGKKGKEEQHEEERANKKSKEKVKNVLLIRGKGGQFWSTFFNLVTFFLCHLLCCSVVFKYLLDSLSEEVYIGVPQARRRKKKK